MERDAVALGLDKVTEETDISELKLDTDVAV